MFGSEEEGEGGEEINTGGMRYFDVGRIQELSFLRGGEKVQLRSVPLSIFDCMVFGLDFPVSFPSRSNGRF